MRSKKETCHSWCLGHGDWLNVTIAPDGVSIHAKRVVYGELHSETFVSLTRDTVAKLGASAKGVSRVYTVTALGMIAKAINYLR